MSIRKKIVGSVVFTVALLPGVLAAQPVGGEVYEVRLRDLAAVDEPEVVAAQLASAGHGEVVSLRDGVVTLRLSGTQARVVAADPRVEAVTLSSTTRVAATAAERTPWSSGVAYTYDGSGNVRKIGTDVFFYDAVNRLVQSDTNGIQRNYAYDAYGNRTKCVEEEGTPSQGDCQYGFTANTATNRLSGVTHDAAGNVTVFGSHSYTYDAVNMQTRDVWGSLVREYVYTAGDERLAIYSGSGWRWTVRDPSGKVLREFTSTGTNGTTNWQWAKDNIWRDGLLLASKQREGATTTTYHYHLDHLGTPRRITDDSDRIIGSHDYFPFGTEASGGQNEPSLSLLKFTGHERDLVGGESWDTLDYMHARFESPMMGRFITVDPVLDLKKAVEQPQRWNRYAYVLNNPVRFTDPTGRYECQGNDRECKVIDAAIAGMKTAAAGLKEGSAQRVRLEEAIALFGDKGQKNGVFVRTDLTRLVPAATKTGGLITIVRLNLDFAMFAASSGKNGSVYATEMSAMMAHEGGHGVVQRLTGGSRTGAQNRASEWEAFYTQASVNEGAGHNSRLGIWTRAGGLDENAIQKYVEIANRDFCSQPGADCQ